MNWFKRLFDTSSCAALGHDPIVREDMIFRTPRQLLGKEGDPVRIDLMSREFVFGETTCKRCGAKLYVDGGKYACKVIP